MHRYLSFFLIIFWFPDIVFAQQDSCNISFTIDSKVVKNIEVHITQANRIIHTDLNKRILVKAGVPMDIDFYAKEYLFPAIRRLVVFSDTTLSISISTPELKEVTVTGTRRLVKETLSGFEYNPQRDSIFRNQPLLYALQRLPFIFLSGDVITYKNEGKILFLIDGKERKGIGNTWSALLKNIKTSDIYKVELITEVPASIANRDYSAVINIFTNGANIYGKSLAVSTKFDERKNLNNSINLTVLHKKSDYSFGVSNAMDNYKVGKGFKTYDDGVLMDMRHIESKCKYTRLAGNFGYGLRIDSTKDLALTGSISNWKANYGYKNLESLSINQDQKINNNNTLAKLTLSFINRKTKIGDVSLSTALEWTRTDINNSYSQFGNKALDSIADMSKKLAPVWIIEFDVFKEGKDGRYKIDGGVQVYGKKIGQNYYKYSVDSLTGANLELLFYQPDSAGLSVFSFKPYIWYMRKLDAKRALILNFESEYYTRKNIGIGTKSFILPDFEVKYKKLLKHSLSVITNLKFSVYTPSDFVQSPISTYSNPIEEKIGNPALNPSKSVSWKISLTSSRKSVITNSIGLSYNFDGFESFTVYDSARGMLVSQVKEGAYSTGVKYNLDLKTTLWKKIVISSSNEIRYWYNKNSEFNTDYSGLQFYSFNTVYYPINKRVGSLDIFFRMFTNPLTSQGYSASSSSYSLSWYKSIVKNKVAMRLNADNFLLKNRNAKSYTVFEKRESYMYSKTPYRLFSVQLFYRFSNIKMMKTAEKKTPSISNEK